MSKSNKQVLKLYATKAEIIANKNRIMQAKNVTDDEIEQLKPKKILEKIIGNKTKIVTPGDAIISQMFTYEEADILVILDEQNKPWYKAKHVCDILEYTKHRTAISNNVDKKYKKSYAEMGAHRKGSLKIDPQTIFINNTGLFSLISRSKKKQAVELWEFITEEVLPELFTTGTYSLPAKQNDVDRLNKSFYDDEYLSNYKNKLAVYLAYIGKYKGKHILKFGKSNDFVKRDLDQHRKMYKKFNVIKIWETLANDLVEENIKTNFASKQMLITLTKDQLNIECKEATKRELVVLNEVNDLDYCLDMINTVVTTTILPQENKYLEEIKEQKHKYELIKSENKHLKEMNAQLKDNLNDLRKKQKS